MVVLLGVYAYCCGCPLKTIYDCGCCIMSDEGMLVIVGACWKVLLEEVVARGGDTWKGTRLI